MKKDYSNVTVKLYVANSENHKLGGWLTLPAKTNDIHLFLIDTCNIIACGDDYSILGALGPKEVVTYLKEYEENGVFDLSDMLEDIRENGLPID